MERSGNTEIPSFIWDYDAKTTFISRKEEWGEGQRKQQEGASASSLPLFCRSHLQPPQACGVIHRAQTRGLCWGCPPTASTSPCSTPNAHSYPAPPVFRRPRAPARRGLGCPQGPESVWSQGQIAARGSGWSGQPKLMRGRGER